MAFCLFGEPLFPGSVSAVFHSGVNKRPHVLYLFCIFHLFGSLIVDSSSR